jgi:hypothetical protein
MKVEVAQYRGRMYLYIDYRGAKNAHEMNSILEQAAELNKRHPEIDRGLANLTEIFMTEEFAEKVKGAGNEHRMRMALLGAKALAGIIAKGIDRDSKLNTRLFDDEREAKDWLMSDL